MLYDCVMSALPPIAGDVSGEVVEARTISIHGDLYHDLVLQTTTGAPERTQLRAPSHACPRAPEVGDRVVVSLLMGQVTGVRFEE